MVQKFGKKIESSAWHWCLAAEKFRTEAVDRGYLEPADSGDIFFDLMNEYFHGPEAAKQMREQAVFAGLSDAERALVSELDGRQRKVLIALYTLSVQRAPEDSFNGREVNSLSHTSAVNEAQTLDYLTITSPKLVEWVFRPSSRNGAQLFRLTESGKRVAVWCQSKDNSYKAHRSQEIKR